MAEDLATYHHPLTDLFEQPKSAAEWSKYRLSDEQVAHYNRYGYLSDVKILTEAQCDKYAQ